MDLPKHWRSHSLWPSALRFAIAMSVADSLVWWLFRDGDPVIMGSFAVICLLYFLNYQGSIRDRVVGYAAATAVGLIVITAGSLLAQPLALAVVGAFAISFLFAYARVLRGYIARASVGLQGAFFLPLMASTSTAEIPSMLAAWLIGSGVAMAASVLLFPKSTLRPMRKLMGDWLTAAAHMCTARATGSPVRASGNALHAASQCVEDAARDSALDLGMVGSRQRALAQMVDGTQWGSAALQLLDHATTDTSNLPEATVTLLNASAAAFSSAAQAMANPRPPLDVPDMAVIRESDLSCIGNLTPEELEEHYPVRLVSILAMRMLWLAGAASGARYPAPDIGSAEDRAPLALLRLNLGFRSVWFANAVRTAACTAACVLLVRALGLEHGLWVVLAALAVTQVSFSATANGTTSLWVSLGAMAGVAVASLGAILNLPHPAFVVLLPILAFLAFAATRAGPFWSQLFYTPFALTNLAALQWASARDLELVRVEDIALGVAVAAGFALLVFPYGLARQLSRQSRQARSTTVDYLASAIAVAHGQAEPAQDDKRVRCIQAVSLLEATLNAASIRPTLTTVQLRDGHEADNLARDRVIGGDACLVLGRRASTSPEFRPIADAFADWWQSNALNARAPGQD